MTETTCDREKAEAILGAEFIQGQDYYIRTTDQGQEELWGWGDDQPSAINRTNTSWLSPGVPE